MRILKRNLAFVLALVMALSMTVSAAKYADYTDVNDITFEEAVDTMTGLGIIEGTDGALLPKENLNRAAAAKIIAYMMLGKDAAESLPKNATQFTDVPAGHWAAGYVAYCANEGIIGGYNATTFGPEDGLTHTQFAKMLLCAAGFGQNNEFVGAGWDINVNKTALTEGVYDNNLGVNYAGVATREEAILYAFNTLTAIPTVEYSDLFGAYYTGKIFDDTVNEDEYTLGYLLYDLVEIKTAGSDDFGRGTHQWKAGSKLVSGKYSNEPDATYTASVKSGKIYEDLGLTVDVEVADVEVLRNNEAATAYRITNDKKVDDDHKNKDQSFGGKGVLTEVYGDENGVTIIMIDTYLGQITNYDAEDKVATVEVGNGEYTFDTAVEYADDDFVLVTLVADEIITMEAAVVEEGDLTGVASDKANVTFNGEKIDAAAQQVIPTLTKDNIKNNTYDLILDNYGYVLTLNKVDEAEDETVGYVMVTASEGQTSSLSKDNLALVEVRYLDGEGTEVLSLDTKKTTPEGASESVMCFKNADGEWEAIDDSEDLIDNGFYAYSMTDEGEIVLKALVAETNDDKDNEYNLSAEGKIDVDFDGKTNGKINSETNNYRLNTNTVVHVIDEDDNVTTYEGYKNIKFEAEDVEVLAITAGDTDLLKEVFILGETESTTEATVVWATGEYDIVADGIEVEVYENGKKAYYVLDADKFENALAEGLTLVTFNEDGEINEAKTATWTDAKLEVSDELVVTSFKSGSHFVAGNETYLLSADVELYDVTDGIKTLTKLAADDEVIVVIDTEADEVVVVFVTGEYEAPTEVPGTGVEGDVDENENVDLEESAAE